MFLGDPGAKFFCGKLGTGTKKEKRSKKERKRRPVETDAADGNPLTTRIPTAAWKAQNAFHSSHKARRRFIEGLDSPAGWGQIKRSKGAKSS